MTRNPIGRIALALLLLGACRSDPAADPGAADGGTGTDRPWRYAREYLFAAPGDPYPIAATWRFEAQRTPDGIDRVGRAGYAARGEWTHVLDDRWASGSGSGVWRVIPHGALRLQVAGGEPTTLRAGEEDPVALRLGRALSGWQGDERNRFRLREAELAGPGAPAPGVVVEETDASRSGRALRPDATRDLLLLQDSAGGRLLLARTEPVEPSRSREVALLQGPAGERSWRALEVMYPAQRAVPEVGGEVPAAWRFEVPGAGVRGEVRAMATSTRPGDARAGGRGVAMHATVRGWVERNGERVPVTGVARHERG